MYLDRLPSKTQAGVSTDPRGNAGMSFGGINTGEATRQFVGDLAEIRFYDAPLSSLEAANVIESLTYTYLEKPLPEIVSFKANINLVVQGMSATLSWVVSNSTGIAIDNGVGGQSSATGSVQVIPALTTTYTLTASNSAGIRTAQTTIAVDPGIPTANPQAVSVARNMPRNITLTGQDPQNSSLTFTLVQSPAHGILSGTPPILVYTPQADYVGGDFFTFRVNDGTYDSLPATVEVFIDDQARAPHGIFLNTTTVDASAAQGAFLAALRAVDSNRFDTHVFSLVGGAGATNNNMFTVSGSRLLAGPGFPTQPGTNLWIRVRATDSTGLFAERIFGIEAKAPERHIVINEIHYNPPENTIPEEFIELYNPSNAPVNLSLWRLRGGVDFVFTNGTVIPAGGFLVVASRPDIIQSRYGVPAAGPWAGNLSGDGERVSLQDPTDTVVDEVDYKSEFPWPIAANGNGPSMELINPPLDNNLGSSWASLGSGVPTPGKINAVFSTTVAPNIRQVAHSPKQPGSTNQVRVTARVTDPEGVNSVVLSYQVVAPGNFLPSYIPLTVAELNANPAALPQPNPAFEASTNWVSVAMHDDGLNGDAQAGDDVYSAVLPVQANRTLVRYRITCSDTLGATRRSPFADDPSLNFAYFVYDGLPAYAGVAATNLSTVPVYWMLTRNADFSTCTAYDAANQLPQFSGSLANEARFVFNWPAAFVYDGEVYDHIRYRLRGANGRYQSGKRNFRLRFNGGRCLAAKDEFGTPYPRKWSSLNTGKGQSNRETLTFALNEYVNYILLNKVGVPAPRSHYFHWRVVRGAQEAPDNYNGDFYGFSWVQEDYDAAFLESHGLPKGNLYKLINAQRSADPYMDMVNQQRYQGAYAVTNGGDAVRIQNALLNPNTSQTDAWLLDNVNYTNWYAYHTILEAVRNYDTWPSANKNAAWYFDTNYTAANAYSGRFWTFPWDWTDTWGPTWNAGQDLAWNGIWGPTSSIHTNMLRDYRNTMREIRGLLLQPDQVNPLIDAVAARLAPIAAADMTRWSYATPGGASYSSLANPGPGFPQGLAAYVRDLKEFMFTGGNHGWWVDRQAVSAGGWITRLDSVATDSQIPAQPTLYYVGQPNYPMNSLTFECLPFADPQGAGSFAGMQWRLAEVQNTNQLSADPRVAPPMEWDSVWDSGLLQTWTNRITIPGIYVQTNRIYRSRVRHLDSTGRWSKWSVPVQFSVTAVDVTALLREGLRVSEIMYNPPAMGIYSGDDLEFLELKIVSNNTLDLSGLVFNGITFTFPNGTILAPGQTFLLGRNSAALSAKYPGLVVNGIYSGKLENAGETIQLNTPTGTTILEVTYGNSPPWPATADGLGWSLVLADPIAGTYRGSTAYGGSPGTDDPASAIPRIVINELLTHTDPPLLDSIELHNPASTNVNLGGWFLTDDRAVPKKFRIPAGTVISAGGYRVFNEADFGVGNGAFQLSSLGDDAYVFSGDTMTNLTGYAHGATFGPSENGVTFGRYVNSVGMEDFVAMSARTLGTNNSRPLLGPVVISEIMFQPPALGPSENVTNEFIELQNVMATNVPLYALDFPSNTWRLGNAVDFSFPVGTVLPVDGRLLVVGFDPITNLPALASFRLTYDLGTNVPVFGPWSGRLGNIGETVELKFPDQPEIDGFVPYVMVEKVGYRSDSPWPTGAAGTGYSLQRATLLAYANDPTNWFAALPTAGSLSPRTSTDVDGDGVPDVWEMTHGSDPFVPDSANDPDGDGFTNYDEWLAGTDPQNPTSYLKIDGIRSDSNSVTLHFTAMANRTYTILSAPTPAAEIWFKTIDVPAALTNRVFSYTTTAIGANFYRVVTPAQP